MSARNYCWRVVTNGSRFRLQDANSLEFYRDFFGSPEGGAYTEIFESRFRWRAFRKLRRVLTVIDKSKWWDVATGKPWPRPFNVPVGVQ
jgi:hypothetical protein